MSPRLAAALSSGASSGCVTISGRSTAAALPRACFPVPSALRGVQVHRGFRVGRTPPRGPSGTSRVLATGVRVERSTAPCSPQTRRDLLSAVLLLGAGAGVVLGDGQSARAAYVDEAVATRVFEASQAAVVSIVDYEVKGDEEKQEGVGSGIVWDHLGHIVTNYHCISKLANDRTGSQATKVEVTLPNGRTSIYQAALVGYFRGQDLAVLKIDAPPEDLTPIKIGASEDLRVGQSVYAIGNPFGLQHTLTVGCVSGLGRTIPSMTGDRIYGVIQTDASISAGNSGGALLDSFGRLVGINTATFTRRGSGRSSGVNFAVAVDKVMEAVPGIIVKKSQA